MSSYHVSVLLQEAIEALQIKNGEKYIDATLGAGGHTREMTNRGGKVLAIDQDEEAIAYAEKQIDPRVVVVEGNFENIGEYAKTNGFEKVAGVLFDLGISSHQVDESTRGFSFLKDAPLDMRMSTKQQVKASDLINGLNKGELIALFTKYGEEPFARKIAEKIVKEREQQSLTTTTQLAQLIASAYPGGFHKIHPATKVFQALRIAVNDELFVLEKALSQVPDLLKSNGRVVVITFHSLEDRIIKHTFIDWEEKGLGKVITKKPIIPTEEEIEKNKRSRSAKLRIFEKI